MGWFLCVFIYFRENRKRSQAIPRVRIIIILFLTQILIILSKKEKKKPQSFFLFFWQRLITFLKIDWGERTIKILEIRIVCNKNNLISHQRRWGWGLKKKKKRSNGDLIKIKSVKHTSYEILVQHNLPVALFLPHPSQSMGWSKPQISNK